MIIAAMVDEATNDMEAIHVLIICAANMVSGKDKWHGCGIMRGKLP
jgi:hypothetical protein